MGTNTKEYMNAWMRRARKLRKESGMCTGCGAHPTIPGLTKCAVCRKRDREHGPVRNEKRKRLYWEKARLGIRVQQGCREKAVAGKRCCQSHLSHISNRHWKKYSEKHKQERISRKLRGLCASIGCRSRAKKGRTLCAKHLTYNRLTCHKYYESHRRKH